MQKKKKIKKKRLLIALKARLSHLLDGFKCLSYYVNCYNLIIVMIKLRGRTIRKLMEMGDVSLRFLITL